MKLVVDLPAAVRRRALLVLLKGFQRGTAIDAADGDKAAKEDIKFRRRSRQQDFTDTTTKH